MEMDVDTYARILVEIIAAGAGRGAVLAKHGLDEASWVDIDSAWQAKLSEAMDGDEDGVGPLLSRYLSAYGAAQAALGPPIPLEQFAELTRLLQASGDLQASLAKVGVSLDEYVRGSAHWSRRLAEDPDIERQFEAVLHRRSG